MDDDADMALWDDWTNEEARRNPSWGQSDPEASQGPGLKPEITQPRDYDGSQGTPSARRL